MVVYLVRVVNQLHWQRLLIFNTVAQYQYMKKFAILCSIILVFFIALPARAFEISPIKLLLTADSDSTQTIVLKVKNTADKDLPFSFTVLGMRQDGAGLPVFERGINSAEAWVYPESNAATLKAGETKSINFIVKIPAQTAPGSYYVGLSAEPTTSSNLNARLVSLLTLQVSGIVQESLLIEKWDVKGIIDNQQGWQFNLGIKNAGSVEVPISGQVHIRNYKGTTIFSEPISAGNTLLVGAKRLLSPQIMLQHRLQLPGLYQAQIQLSYGKPNQTASAIVYVWYIPWWGKLVGGAVIILFLVLLTKFWIKRRKY